MFHTDCIKFNIIESLSGDPFSFPLLSDKTVETKLEFDISEKNMTNDLLISTCIYLQESYCYIENDTSVKVISFLGRSAQVFIFVFVPVLSFCLAYLPV